MCFEIQPCLYWCVSFITDSRLRRRRDSRLFPPVLFRSLAVTEQSRIEPLPINPALIKLLCVVHAAVCDTADSSSLEVGRLLLWSPVNSARLQWDVDVGLKSVSRLWFSPADINGNDTVSESNRRGASEQTWILHTGVAVVQWRHTTWGCVRVCHTRVLN